MSKFQRLSRNFGAKKGTVPFFVAACLALLLGGLAPAAADTARGTVFHDENGNGTRDRGESGIPNVSVSNGFDVVATDERGRYELDVDDDAIIFITKPAGWMTPVNAQMLPQFYYIHQPDGSPPGLRYRGISPTGRLPDTIDFALKRSSESKRFEAILFADTQPQSSAEVDYIRDDVVSELIGTNAVFGMTLGDIVHDDMSLFGRLNSVIAQVGVPWYNVPGNHELNLLSPDDRYSLETFKSIYGPPYYSFEYGDAHFIVLDNVFYEGDGEPDPADFRGTGGYKGRLTDAQLEWLKRDIATVPPDRLIFLAMHVPLRRAVSGEPLHRDMEGLRALLALLGGREHLYAVAGHTHTTQHHYLGVEDGFSGPGTFHHHVLATVSGSWWSGPIDSRGIPTAEQRDGTPNGYHILEVDGTDVAVRYKAAGHEADYQMRIMLDAAHATHRPEVQRAYRRGELLDGRLSIDEVAAADVIVNLFDGGPRSRVSFQIDDGLVHEMRRRPIFDPSTRDLYARNEATIKPWVNAVRSTHMFVADLPDDLTPGTYTLTVRATDEFGRGHHAHKIIEIEGSSAERGSTRYP